MSIAAISGFSQGFAQSRSAKKDRDQRQRINDALDKLTVAPPSLGVTPAASGGMPASGAPAGGMGAYRSAIASIESAGSGDYGAIGPANERLGRPLGRYQVMEANLGPWSESALGRRITAEEFLASPELQDRIFDHRFGQYVAQFGPEGAAQAWFSGPAGVGKLDRKDVLGTSVGAYTTKFNRALGVTPR